MHTTSSLRSSRTPSGTFDKLAKDAHEQVVYGYDEATGLKAVIAIHSTALGPALGGTRIWDYAHDDDALVDVLRLSKGMTYKAALANLKLGGGKAVILGNVEQIKTKPLLSKYGQLVDSLHGRYITAPDVNTDMHDMVVISAATRHVRSLPKAQGGSGDPSFFTAYGTYLSIKAAAKKVYGSEQLQDKKVGVQGVGKVGAHLVDHLCQAGAQVYVTDIVPTRVAAITQRHKVHAVLPNEFYALPLDIYAPCALGSTLNDATIPQLQCRIIAGGANNQLENAQRHGQLLFDRGIVYVPDFLANVGGLINVHTELYHTYSHALAQQHTERIYATCLEVLDKSAQEKNPPSIIAAQLAEARLRAATSKSSQS